MEATSERIRMLMDEQHITQKRLAAELQVSNSSLCNYLHGNRWISLSLLRGICRSLNISSDYIIGLSDRKNTLILSEDEQTFLELYRTLSPRSKRCALYQLQELSKLCKITDH